MSVLEQIRAQGFTLRPVDGGLYIEPIHELSDIQRQWLSGHKHEIRNQLLTERWQWFLSLSAKHGIHPNVVAAEHPTEQDRLDVVEPEEHDDERLQRLMATICGCPRVQQRQQDYEDGTWVPISPDDSTHY